MKRSTSEYEDMARAEMEGTLDFEPLGPVEELAMGRPRDGGRGNSPTRTVRFPEPLLNRLEQLAQAQNVSTSVLIRRATIEYLERNSSGAQ
ncbi:MAG: CopG family transcriptional regulator [Rhodococcus sp.]|nr:CopG family transcriptional regulator [Rhodococcus sp. (in: high G+C Gram-positive bacteria)]